MTHSARRAEPSPETPGDQRSARMLTTLTSLREALQHARLPYEVPDVDRTRSARAEMVDQLEDYVLPRLVQIDAPLLAVVGGSTGAGKSTLVNSLVGARVSEPGVLRPTTRSPVLVHHPDDAAWFDGRRVLPDLERTTRATADPGGLQVVSSVALPPGLALLDAPDIDSVEERNRSLASQLLAAADLWLFVTSAARYADQVPWDFLEQAADRSAAVAIVLDRTAAASIDEVSGHLARMLTARGLKDSPLFTVSEEPLDDAGLLPAPVVADIKDWLRELGEDTEARNGVVRQTLDGAIRSVSRRTFDVADACQAQLDVQARLTRDVDASYDAGRGRGRERRRRRHPAARRGARALAGVRRHRRAAQGAGVQGQLVARPVHQCPQGQAPAGRAADGRGRVGPADAAARARRVGRRARRRVVALDQRGRPGARGRRCRPVALLARLSREGRADGARLADRRARPRAHRGRRQARDRPLPRPTASTGSPSR